MRKFLPFLLIALFLVACDGEMPASETSGEIERIPSVFLENGYTFPEHKLADVVPVERANAVEVSSLIENVAQEDIDEIYFQLAKTKDSITYVVLPRYAGLRFELYEGQTTAPVYSYRTKAEECIFVTVDRGDAKENVLTVVDGEKSDILTLPKNELATREEVNE